MAAAKKSSTKRPVRSHEDSSEMSDSDSSSRSAASPRSSSRSSSASASARSLPLNKDMLTNIDYKQIMRDLYTNPTVRYMAGGVAAAVLNRFANRISDKYPEISTFLRENIGTLEGKLNDFKNGADSAHGSESRQ